MSGLFWKVWEGKGALPLLCYPNQATPAVSPPISTCRRELEGLSKADGTLQPAKSLRNSTLLALLSSLGAPQALPPPLPLCQAVFRSSALGSEAPAHTSPPWELPIICLGWDILPICALPTQILGVGQLSVWSSWILADSPFSMNDHSHLLTLCFCHIFCTLSNSAMLTSFWSLLLICLP